MKRGAFHVKRFLMLMVFVLVFAAMTVSATEGEPSGPTEGPGSETPTDPSVDSSAENRIQCGANVYGTLSNGILTISGNGDMWNFESEDQSVFAAKRAEILVIVIGNGVTRIGSCAFAKTNCNRLVIGTGVQEIGKRAFGMCDNLNEITIPGNVLKIGTGAFRECKKLIQCHLTQGLEEISSHAFKDTPMLKSIDIPATVKTIGEGAFRRSGLTEVKMASGLRTIGQYAFCETALTKVVIPGSVETIKQYAFHRTGLTEAIIAEGVKKTIETRAFGKISATICGEDISFGPQAFAAGSTFLLRQGSKAETYAKANGLNIVYLDCVQVNGVPTDHSWDTGTVTKASTCKEQGVKTYKCTKCGATKTENLPLSAHSFGAWVQTKAPTVFEKGSQIRTCTVCRYTKTKNIAKVTPVIALNTKTLTLSVGETYKLMVTSKGAGDSVTSWSSTNKKIATVGSAGKVSAKSPGTAKIRVTLRSGLSANVKLTVQKVATQELVVKAKGAKLKNGKISVKKGKKFNLIAQVKPAGMAGSVKFSSSKKNVATVDGKGLVKAKKKGKTKITVKSDKKKVTITVTVK